MSRSVRSEQKAEPNLTPILDMVFQLITFFMLVINFKSAELDLGLKLPVLGSARPVPADPTQLLVLNIRHDKAHPNGYLNIYGIAHEFKEDRDRHEKEGPQPSDIETYIANERAAAHLTKQDVQEGKQEVPMIVVIRADRGTPFHALNRIITACQENGFRQFALKALNKEKD